MQFSLVTLLAALAIGAQANSVFNAETNQSCSFDEAGEVKCVDGHAEDAVDSNEFFADVVMPGAEKRSPEGLARDLSKLYSRSATEKRQYITCVGQFGLSKCKAKCKLNGCKGGRCRGTGWCHCSDC